MKIINFKNIKLLKEHLDEFNNIKKRRKGTKKKEYRKINKAIKIARTLLILPNKS